MDALAVQYAMELSVGGSRHRSSCPAHLHVDPIISQMPDIPRTKRGWRNMRQGRIVDWCEDVQKAFDAIVPSDADVSPVADAIVAVVDAVRQAAIQSARRSI